jgi:Family of unknown function (DUF5681)
MTNDLQPEANLTIEEPQSERVGNKVPPRSTRFKKGQSGNPKGRPKGSANISTVFFKTLREKVVINENGRRKTVTKYEAALKQLSNKAASGDLRAISLLAALARECEAKQSLVVAETNVLNAADEEVIAGILGRFQPSDSQAGEGEGNDSPQAAGETSGQSDQARSNDGGKL